MLVASKIQGNIIRQSFQHNLVSNMVQITWEWWQQPDPAAGTAKIWFCCLFKASLCIFVDQESALFGMEIERSDKKWTLSCSLYKGHNSEILITDIRTEKQSISLKQTSFSMVLDLLTPEFLALVCSPK